MFTNPKLPQIKAWAATIIAAAGAGASQAIANEGLSTETVVSGAVAGLVTMAIVYLVPESNPSVSSTRAVLRRLAIEESAVEV